MRLLPLPAGLIGTAPSQELLDIWNKREAELVEAGPEGTTLGGVLHTRPLGEHAEGGGCLAEHRDRGDALHKSCCFHDSRTDRPLPGQVLGVARAAIDLSGIRCRAVVAGCVGA